MNKIDELKDRIKIAGNNFIIKNITYQDNENYTCSIEELKLEAHIRVIGESMVQLNRCIALCILSECLLD